jgi:hypothetical protein
MCFGLCPKIYVNVVIQYPSWLSKWKLKWKTFVLITFWTKHTLRLSIRCVTNTNSEFVSCDKFCTNTKAREWGVENSKESFWNKSSYTFPPFVLSSVSDHASPLVNLTEQWSLVTVTLRVRQMSYTYASRLVVKCREKPGAWRLITLSSQNSLCDRSVWWLTSQVSQESG